MDYLGRRAIRSIKESLKTIKNFFIIFFLKYVSKLRGGRAR